MTKYDVIEKFYDDIKSQLSYYTEEAMRSNGKVKYTIYCWSQSGVEVLEDVRGGDLTLSPDKYPGQQLFKITEIDHQSIIDDYDGVPTYIEGDDEQDTEDEEYWVEPDDCTDDDIDQLVYDMIKHIDWDQKMDEIIDEIYYEEE